MKDSYAAFYVHTERVRVTLVVVSLGGSLPYNCYSHEPCDYHYPQVPHFPPSLSSTQFLFSFCVVVSNLCGSIQSSKTDTNNYFFQGGSV